MEKEVKKTKENSVKEIPEGQEPEGKRPKRKVPGGVIFLGIVIILVAVFAIIYFTASEEKLGECSESKQCEVYNIRSPMGEKYLCMNAEKEGDSFNKKLLMFKYNLKNGQEEEISECVCESEECVPV